MDTKLWVSFGLVVVCLGFSAIVANDSEESSDEHPWEEDIQTFEYMDERNSTPKQAVLFVGSSSIRMMKTAIYFPELPVINRGFGGSMMKDLIYYLDRIIIPYQPKVIVLYCGANDLLEGEMAPKEVFEHFVTFVDELEKRLPKTSIVFLSNRIWPDEWDEWHMVIEKYNRLVKEYSRNKDLLYYVDVETGMLNREGKPDPSDYMEDRIHLNDRGYDKWIELFKPVVKKVYHQ